MSSFQNNFVKLGLLCVSALLICFQPALADETPYYDIEGNQIVILKTDLNGIAQQSRLLDGQEHQICLVKRTLAGGGDIVWRDKTGRIRLRKTPTRGIIYYPDYRLKGVPLLDHVDPNIKTYGDQSLDQWDKAYPYRGDVNMHKDTN